MAVESIVPAPEDRSAYRGLLRNRNYRLWFAAGFTSSLGDWTGFVALQALVVSLSPAGSRTGLFALGGVMMARLLPSLVVGPVAGVLADRYDRKRLMVFTDVVRGALFTGIAFSNDLTTLFTLTFVVECMSLLYMSAKDAALPTIVDKHHLTQANQLNLLVGYGTLPLGAIVATAIAGVLRAVGLDPRGATVAALLVNAATFAVAALLVSRARVPARARRADAEERPGVVAELREGLEVIGGLPIVRALIQGVVGVFFGAGVIVTLGPEFVRTSLGRASTDWFTLITFVGLGLVLGILLVPVVTRVAPMERLFPVSLAATGALAAGVAMLPNFPLTLVFGFLVGSVAGLAFVMGYTLLQSYTPDAVRGRVLAGFYTATRVSLFTSLGIAPFLAGAIGRGTLIVGNNVVSMSGVRITILLGGLVALFSAVTAGRAMYASLREEPGRHVTLWRRRDPQRRGGVFIVFEGVEGSGKSTQVKTLVAALEAEGRDVVVTREPGGSPIGDRIRALLLDPNAEGMHPRTEALLYAAARTEHVHRVILPALESGKVVVCDRYLDSSLAYQGSARGLGIDDVLEINQWATGGVVPDVVVLLHLDPDVGLQRVAERARRGQRGPDGLPRIEPVGDRIEREDLAFHRRVAEAYLELARRDRGRYLVVDASADAGTVARQVRSALHTWLPLPGTDTGEQRSSARPGAAG